MGPAYYTKLICFTNRNLGGYIMDQWTAKSINLLTNSNLVSLTSGGLVSDSNDCNTYEMFCNYIEELAKHTKLSPLDTEEALFSYGGKKKGYWRNTIIKHFPIKTSGINKDYNSNIVMNMEPINYDVAINFLNNGIHKIPTLGNRSQIEVEVINNQLLIRNSKGNTFKISGEHWHLVMNRISSLPLNERYMTSRYGHGNFVFNWNDAPNRVFSIYIPAVVRYLLNLPE
jgi:hypothetical protein